MTTTLLAPPETWLPIRDFADTTLDDGPPLPSASTLRRWAIAGFRGVKLRSRRRGVKLFTSAAAISEFLSATAAA